MAERTRAERVYRGRSYDVVGIGNAIVDIIARCDDAFSPSTTSPKGTCAYPCRRSRAPV
jgi:hypothetical protein